MTNNQSADTRESVKAVTAEQSTITRWIEDPMASAYLAAGITAAAITSVLTGMWIVSLVLS